MTKNDMFTLVINHPKADRSDKMLARKLAKVNKRTATLALLNIVRRVARAA